MIDACRAYVIIMTSVRPSVCLSVRNVGVLWSHSARRCEVFDTTRKDNHSSFQTPRVVGGRRSLLSEICAQSDPAPSKSRLRQTFRGALSTESSGLIVYMYTCVQYLTTVALAVPEISLETSNLQKAQLMQRSPVRAHCRLKSCNMLHKCSTDGIWRGLQPINDLQSHSRSLQLLPFDRLL